MSAGVQSDRIELTLTRLAQIIRELPVLFEHRTAGQPPRLGRDGSVPVIQPSFWWSNSLAPQPKFVRRSEDLCRRIEFNATSIHRLAAFARTRYRVPQSAAGVAISARIVDCPLAGTHCTGWPTSCLLRKEGLFYNAHWQARIGRCVIGVN